jgi:hypothetical protein
MDTINPTQLIFTQDEPIVDPSIHTKEGYWNHWDDDEDTWASFINDQTEVRKKESNQVHLYNRWCLGLVTTRCQHQGRLYSPENACVSCTIADLYQRPLTQEDWEPFKLTQYKEEEFAEGYLKESFLKLKSQLQPVQSHNDNQKPLQPRFPSPPSEIDFPTPSVTSDDEEHIVYQRPPTPYPMNQTSITTTDDSSICSDEYLDSSQDTATSTSTFIPKTACPLPEADILTLNRITRSLDQDQEIFVKAGRLVIYSADGRWERRFPLVPPNLTEIATRIMVTPGRPYQQSRSLQQFTSPRQAVKWHCKQQLQASEEEQTYWQYELARILQETNRQRRVPIGRLIKWLQQDFQYKNSWARKVYRAGNQLLQLYKIAGTERLYSYPQANISLLTRLKNQEFHLLLEEVQRVHRSGGPSH